MDNNDTRKCPACGGDNACAMAAGKAPESCWCQSVVVSAAAIAALPASEQGRRCLCQGCATREEKTT